MQRLVVPGRWKSAKHVQDFKAIHREEEPHQVGFFCSGDGDSIGLPDAAWFSPSLQLLRKKRSKRCERGCLFAWLKIFTASGMLSFNVL
jgi:hypothetical protein